MRQLFIERSLADFVKQPSYGKFQFFFGFIDTSIDLSADVRDPVSADVGDIVNSAHQLRLRGNIDLVGGSRFKRVVNLSRLDTMWPNR